MNKRINFSFYGDDFTGSTDAMEALYLYGLDTVLFLEIPDKSTLDKFKDIDCIGFAGTARAKSKEEIKKELEPVFSFIKKLNPTYFHYKVCSTFDSSNKVGSIGYAADLARSYFNNKIIHTLVAVPQLGRYTVFGEHFAKKEEYVYRLDRHPIMANHPVTPMKEANLKKHLSKQTKQKIKNLTLLDYHNGVNLNSVTENQILIYDTISERDLKNFTKHAFVENETTSFILGSSGVEYAYGSFINNKNKTLQNYRVSKETKAEKVFVASGSLSEISKEQIEYAESHEYTSIRLPINLLDKKDVCNDFVKKVKAMIEKNKKVILYTAKGITDPYVQEINSRFKDLSKDGVGEMLGVTLGKYTKAIMEDMKIDRLIVAGGDTSGFVMNELDIYALKVYKSISPGAPLCVAYSKSDTINQSIIGLKGGQLGGREYYTKIL